MRIAVIADSHGAIDRLEQAFQNIADAGVTQVFHAGDFLVEGSVEVFAKFPMINFFIAIGNNDLDRERLAKISALSHVNIAETVTQKISNYTISMSHYDGIAQTKSREISQNIDIFIHGHTHRPQVVRRKKSTMINPGALCEDGRYIVLDLSTMKGRRILFSKVITW